jgi:capsular polysaccharide biosynthesis protein
MPANHAKAPRRSALPSSRTGVGRAVRRWVAIPILIAALGAAGGFALGSVAQPKAEALVRVNTDAADAMTTEQAAKNVATDLNAVGIFNLVAAKTGQDAEDLQARTRIAAKPNSQIVSISVSAPTNAQAVSEASALADAGFSVTSNRAEGALYNMTNATEEVINSQKLSTKSAERARIARLGDELAAGQMALIADANRLQLLQRGEPRRGLPSAPILGVMGGIVGVLLGVGLALLLGRRGRVKSERELVELYPQAAVIDAADMTNVVNMEPDTRTVIIAGSRGVDAARITELVQRSLVKTTNRDVVIAEKLADVPVNEGPNGHINLVPTTLSESVVRRASRDERSLLVVPVQPGVTRLKVLDHFASRVPDRTYLLVNDRVAWN